MTAQCSVCKAEANYKLKHLQTTPANINAFSFYTEYIENDNGLCVKREQLNVMIQFQDLFIMMQIQIKILV